MRAGVIGHPIGHSKSPAIHGAWIKALGLDAAYDAYDVAPSELAAFLEEHRGGHALRGVNVTIPHKEAAFRRADVVHSSAAKAGAANVLLFRPDGQIEARNTDGEGMMAAFRAVVPDFDPKTARVEIQGAGGAARGAIAALEAAGNTHVIIYNRTPANSVALATEFEGVAKAGMDSKVTFSTGPDIVINATSLGLGGTPSPALDWPPGGPRSAALDMVYGATTTGFIADAAAHGWHTVGGIEMLIGQAAPSFEAFFGVAPPAGYRQIALDALA